MYIFKKKLNEIIAHSAFIVHSLLFFVYFIILKMLHNNSELFFDVETPHLMLDLFQSKSKFSSSLYSISANHN